MKNNETGIRHEYKKEGYSDTIKSSIIFSFSYQCPDYQISCFRYEEYIGVAFNDYYYSLNNDQLLMDIQDIIHKYHVSSNNGYYLYIEGLPDGYGDSLDVIYESGEEIYKYSNQELTISIEAKNAFYTLFMNDALSHGYKEEKPENTINIQELEGIYIGQHFGDEIKVIIKDTHISIYKNKELLDNTNYHITDECIRPVENKTFQTFSHLRMKNQFILVAYFMKESYSTSELLKQKEGIQ